MIKINLSKKVLEAHKAYYKRKIQPVLENAKSVAIHYVPTGVLPEHMDFLTYCLEHIDTLSVGTVEELADVERYIATNFQQVKADIQADTKIVIGTEIKKYGNYLYELFGYEKFKVGNYIDLLKKAAEKEMGNGGTHTKRMEKMTEILLESFPKEKEHITAALGAENCPLNMESYEKKLLGLKGIDILTHGNKLLELLPDEWNDYFFVLKSGTRVCPYCNRQYITTVLSPSGRTRADIDHFLAKNQYPYFSMSIYNMIPVCKICNQALKHTHAYTFDDVHPYRDDMNEKFWFLLDEKNDIQIGDNGEDAIRRHIEIFKLLSLYSFHNNQAKELITKKQAYPPELIEKLYQDNKDLFLDQNAVKQMILGFPNDKSQLNQEALFKMRRDIALSLGFFN